MTKKQLRHWLIAVGVVVVVVSLGSLGFATNDADAGHIALFWLVSVLPAAGVLALWVVIVRARNRNADGNESGQD